MCMMSIFVPGRRHDCFEHCIVAWGLVVGSHAFPAIIAGGGLLTQVAAAGPGFSLNLEEAAREHWLS